MLNLFYQKKTLNDTLIINVSLDSANRVESKDDIVFGYNKDNLVFVNVLNASKHIKNLKDGLLFPNKEIIDQLNKLINFDLSKFFDNGFKVGFVEQCEDIKGTHLHKCVVDIKTKKLNIVCGAKNCRQGLKVVVATNGTMLPNGKVIVTGALLGNKSEGMLCSYRELNIQKEATGIVELNNNEVGSYFMECYSNL